MKKFIICLFAWFMVGHPCQAATKINTSHNSDYELNYLHSEIRILENQLNQKKQRLDKCAKQNKNFQIAGVATVGLAGAGVATNIALHSKIQDQKKQAVNMVNTIEATITKAEIFEKDMYKLAENQDNIDKECIHEKSSKVFTKEEIEHIREIIQKSFDWDTLPESDRLQMAKVISIVRECQKQ